MEKRITITEEQSLYIERLYFEFIGMQSLVTTMCGTQYVDIKEDIFKKVLEEYIQKSTIYNIAWSYLLKEYLYKVEDEKNVIENSIKLDFDTAEIIYVTKGE